MDEIRLGGELCYLRPPEPGDVKLFYALACDQATMESSDDHPFAHPEELRFIRYFTDFLQKASGDYLPFVIVDDETDRPVGQIHAGRIDRYNHNAQIGFQILPQYRRQGFGNDAVVTLLDYLFLDLNLNRVSADVYEYNDASLKLLLTAGMRIEGRYRKWLFRYNRYWDKIILSVLREEWNGEEEPVEWTIEEKGILAFDTRHFMDKIKGKSLEGLAHYIQDHYETVGEIIEGSGAEIIKFIGDGGFALFDSALMLKMRKVAAELEALDVNTVIDSGEVIHGLFGFGEAIQKDAFGDAVNRAFIKLFKK